MPPSFKGLNFRANFFRATGLGEQGEEVLEVIEMSSPDFNVISRHFEAERFKIISLAEEIARFDNNLWDEMPREERRLTALKAVEALIGQQLEHFCQYSMSVDAEAPCFVYPSHDWQNVETHPLVGMVPRERNLHLTVTSFGSGQSRMKYARILAVLQLMQDLLMKDQFATKRELYYRCVKDFAKQSELDDVVNIISIMLQIPRKELRVLATSKGLVAGNLTFLTSGEIRIDCSKALEGELIPQDVPAISSVASDAKAIIIVEKDATFQTIIKEQFLQVMPVILVTGKGIPDLNTRQLLRRLHLELCLPVYCLVDADPYGVEILCVYKFGSLSMAWCSEPLAIPSIKWLGVLPKDFVDLDMDQMIEFTARDKSKWNALWNRPYGDQFAGIKMELETMAHWEKKAEIQNLPSPSKYIVEKLANGDFVE